MFAGLWRSVESSPLELAVRLEPSLRHLNAVEAHARAVGLCIALLGVLLQGALLERGAVAEESFGEGSLILRLDDERINALETVQLLATDLNAGRTALDRWARRFEAA
jgi:hypothetical protein